MGLWCASVRARLAATVRVMVVLASLVATWGAPALPARAAGGAGKSDLIGVAGNAFPWEANWTQFTGMLDNSHAGWARVELRWDQVEPARGRWDWGGTDSLVNAYAQHGFQQLGLLVYSVAWANGGSGNATVFGPPTDLDAWQEYVTQTVRRYKGQIHAWEIWNEPDVAMFWNNQDGGDPAGYLPLLQRAYAAIKAADPTAIVMNGAATGTERGATFVQRLLDLGGGQYLDAVAFHGYVPTGSIDDPFFRTVVWPLVNAAVQRAGKPLWITEVGWGSGYGGGSDAGTEAAQANLLARHLPMLFDLSNLSRVIVFQFKDPNDTPRFFGLTRADGTPKPAYTVLQTYANVLQGLTFQQHVPAADGVWDMRFGNGSRTVDVVWVQPSAQNVTVPATAASVRIWRLTGQVQTQAVAGGAVTVSVGTDPLIIDRDVAEPAPVGGNCRSFPETQHALCGAFLDFWSRYGGLSIFGYPLSDLRSENGLTVQYLERAKLEYHPEAANPDWRVVGELVGRTMTASRGGESPFQRQSGIASNADCNAYGETGHTLCFGFKKYWEQHGGLWMFGYPISQEFQEKNPDTGQVYTVQYFERARFEYHPDLAGTPYEVLLGRLGAQLACQRYSLACVG